MAGVPIGYQTKVIKMQNAQFIQSHPANAFGIDAEDFQEAVSFDHKCEQAWPIWVVFQNGKPVGWWNECADLGFVSE